MQCGLQGSFVIQKRRDGVITQELEFENLITNNGLDYAGQDGAYTGIWFDGSAWANVMVVGSGNTPPTNGDSQLQAIIGSAINVSNNNWGSVYTARAGAVPAYYTLTQSVVVPMNTRLGNWAEIGIGKTATQLFSRALIKDTNGTPIVLTVVANEEVTITYRLKVYYSNTQTTEVINYAGTDYTFVSRLNKIGSGGIYINEPSGYSIFGRYNGASGPTVGGQTSTFGAVSSIGTEYDSSIAGTLLATKDGTTADAYTLGSYVRRWTATFTPTEGVSATPIQAFSSKLGNSGSSVVTSISPSVVKLNTHTLTIKFGVTWGRYV